MLHVAHWLTLSCLRSDAHLSGRVFFMRLLVRHTGGGREGGGEVGKNCRKGKERSGREGEENLRMSGKGGNRR